jgi:hypothetical protein
MHGTITNKENPRGVNVVKQLNLKEVFKFGVMNTNKANVNKLAGGLVDKVL